MNFTNPETHKTSCQSHAGARAMVHLANILRSHFSLFYLFIVGIRVQCVHTSGDAPRMCTAVQTLRGAPAAAALFDRRMHTASSAQPMFSGKKLT